METNHRTLKIGLTSFVGSLVGAFVSLSFCLDYGWSCPLGLLLGFFGGGLGTTATYCLLHREHCRRACQTAYREFREIIPGRSKVFNLVLYWLAVMVMFSTIMLLMMAFMSLENGKLPPPPSDWKAYAAIGILLLLGSVVGFCGAHIMSCEKISRRQTFKLMILFCPLVFPFTATYYTLSRLVYWLPKLINDLLILASAVLVLIKAFWIAILCRKLYIGLLGMVSGTVTGFSLGMASGTMLVPTLIGAACGALVGVGIFEFLSKRVLKLVPMKI